MNGLLSLITEKSPAIVKTTTHVIESDTARGILTTIVPHPDVEIVLSIAFKKKPSFKDLAPAMTIAKELGVKVKCIAAAIGCSPDTVYKAIRGSKKA